MNSTRHSCANVKKDGKVINNCYAVGSVLSGHNRVKMADGTGVSMLTALQAVLLSWA